MFSRLLEEVKDVWGDVHPDNRVDNHTDNQFDRFVSNDRKLIMDAPCYDADVNDADVDLTDDELLNVSSSCLLCLKYIEDTDAERLPCYHTFHTMCVHELVQDNNTFCPACGREFNEVNMHVIDLVYQTCL